MNFHLTTRECYLHCAKLMCPGRPQLGQTNHWHLDEEMWPDAHARQALLMSQAGPSLFISDRSTYLLWQLQVPSWRREEGGLPAAHGDCSMQWHACLGMNSHDLFKELMVHTTKMFECFFNKIPYQQSKLSVRSQLVPQSSIHTNPKKGVQTPWAYIQFLISRSF